MKLQESGEMYLETILVLSGRLDPVRSIDIAGEMGFSKPSISRAMGRLKEDGYIFIEKNGAVRLTDAGYAVASKIYERHRILTKAFMKLGVDGNTAAEDACKIEHYISDITFNAIRAHLEKTDAARRD